jgi:hypothetical protein
LAGMSFEPDDIDDDVIDTADPSWHTLIESFIAGLPAVDE